MGTASDWKWVAFLTIFYGGAMLLWEAVGRTYRDIKPVLLPWDVLTWTFGGVGFGLVTTFHWEAFHWPLILPTVATSTAFVLAAWWPKRKPRSQGVERPRPDSW